MSYERLIGQTIDGRYRADTFLGEGGMAAVILAYDLQEKRNVALKILREDLSEDKAAVKRFVNESKAVSVLSHPNIVKVNDVVMGDELKYIVMEYIEGEALRDYMDRVGQIPFDKTVSIAEQILQALQHAHSKGVIHRDVKPQNIILMKSGKAIITDFGIAKMLGGESLNDEKAMGTVYYISPEQAEGGDIDERSDLYSLGVMLYEMLTGTLPFNGENTLEIAMQQINAQPPHPRDLLPTIPRGMEQIILFALQKDKAERFQSAGQMLKYLQTIKEDPFAEFALTPRRQHEIELEEQEKDRKRKEEERLAAQQEKEDDEEVEVKTVKGDSWSPAPILAGISLAFALVLIIAGYYAVVNIFWNSELNVFRNNAGENVTIENYVGSVFTDAERIRLTDEIGYKKVTVVEDFSETVPAGVVISQDPNSGEVRKLSTVELTVVVSKGSRASAGIFPDYSMQDYRVVRLQLEEMGYQVELHGEVNSAVDSCCILYTVPAAGDSLPKDGLVRIYYSLGVNASDVMFEFPTFLNMTESHLRDFIEKNGLNLVSVRYEYSETVAAGRVISSSISYGPKPKLSPLSVVISLGVDPDTVIPTPTPTPEPTPTPTPEESESGEEPAILPDPEGT